ncbi:MAG TPA: rhomboid family intramembrane serine protease [Bacteroidia bacterium]|jgi:membrane associated rhomboid family serine protease
MRNKTSKVLSSFLYPLAFIAILWIIKFYEVLSHESLAWYGIYPRTIHGLIGVLVAPLLHADYDHLISNTVPLLILGSIIFYFYRSIAFQVFFWVYIMTGIWVWAAARDSYHIGASGILYGFVAFLFFSGVFRKDTRLLALSLFVVFIYGGTVWGIFPIKEGVSWESHMLGALAGLITSYNFKTEGPPPRVYDLGTDEENALIDVSGEQENEIHVVEDNPIQITYTIVPKKPGEPAPDDAPKQ